MNTRIDRILASMAVALTVILLNSCASTAGLDDEDYASVARLNKREPNPVIVIPGILGSRLVSDDGKVVWGAYGIGAIRHGSANGRRALALPMRRNSGLGSLTDEVQQDGTLDRLTLSPGIGLKAYHGLLKALVIGGYRDDKNRPPKAGEHISCFEFGYDWRRPNAENAAALGKFIEETRRFIRAERIRRGLPEREIKFDIVAHSMGGLVGRYYMMYGDATPPTDGTRPQVTWAGARSVHRFIQVGTPNNGSAEAILQLKDGMVLSSFVPKFQAAVIGTFPSTYELLPRAADQPLVDALGRQLDPFDPAVWKRYQWGLAAPSQDKYLQQLLPGTRDRATRLEIALDHQRKSLAAAKAFQMALDCRCTLPAGVTMHAFVGNAKPTVSQLQVMADGSLTPIAYQHGDNTVTARSALARTPDDRPGPIPWTSVHTINAPHMTLPVQPDFIRQLLAILLDLPDTEASTRP